MTGLIVRRVVRGLLRMWVVLTLDFEFRFNAYQEMLNIWEDEAPGTIFYIPIESYGVRSDLFWLPYSFYYMDLRPDNLIYE